MKPNVVRGGGFRGAIAYAMGEGKDHDFVTGNVTGQTPRQLSTEFAVCRQLRPDIKRPVWHTSLSLPAGERLTGERWQAVVNDFMDGMGFDRDSHQFFAVRHNDTQHDHVHIIASRIGLDGSVWHGKWEARKTIDLTQVLEKRHGLTETQGYYKKDEKGLTAGEINMAERTGTKPPKRRLQALVKSAAQGNPTAAQFAEKLVMSGVEVRANVAKTGTMSGFSFGLSGYSFQGSQLGKKFSWTGLQAQGVSYEQTRDSEQLRRLSGATVGKPANTDNLRITDDAAHDQRPAGRVPQLDRPAADGLIIEADDRDTEPARTASWDDRETVIGDVGDRSNRHEKSDLPGDGAGERPSRERSGGDAERSIAGVRRADRGASETSSSNQPGDGEALGRSTAGAGRGSEKPESPEEQLARIDAKHRKTIEKLAGDRRGGEQRKRESEGEQRPSSAPVVASGDHGSGRFNVREYADSIRTLADRHEITSERARGAIDQAIRQSPAPTRPAGRKAPTGRLSRWFSSTKMKLAEFVDKARDYFHDATTQSAGKAGWEVDEIRSSGLSGGLLDRMQEAQASAKAAEQQRQLEQAEQVRKMAEENRKATPKQEPPEPDIDFGFDDDDAPSGPGLG